ncbi:hypothetical protein AKO1_001108, partial [Acrasis kona]
HEATLANLLELILYHQDTLTNLAQDKGNEGQICIVELVDYCARKITSLNIQDPPEYTSKTTSSIASQSPESTFLEQVAEIEFNCQMAALTIIRHIINVASKLSPSIVSRITDTHDFMIMLVYLLEKAPWTRKSPDGKSIYKFINRKWTQVPRTQNAKLTEHQAQVWLAINDLAMDPELRDGYEINSFRKDTILRLRILLTNSLVDQITILTDLQRVIEQLSISNPPATLSKSMLLIEQVPEIREKILEETDFEELAQEQITKLFEEDQEEKQKEMAQLASMFKDMADFVVNKDHHNVELNKK